MKLLLHRTELGRKESDCQLPKRNDIWVVERGDKRKQEVMRWAEKVKERSVAKILVLWGCSKISGEAKSHL